MKRYSNISYKGLEYNTNLLDNICDVQKSCTDRK